MKTFFVKCVNYESNHSSSNAGNARSTSILLSNSHYCLKGRIDFRHKATVLLRMNQDVYLNNQVNRWLNSRFLVTTICHTWWMAFAKSRSFQHYYSSFQGTINSGYNTRIIDTLGIFLTIIFRKLTHLVGFKTLGLFYVFGLFLDLIFNLYQRWSWSLFNLKTRTVVSTRNVKCGFIFS